MPVLGYRGAIMTLGLAMVFAVACKHDKAKHGGGGGAATTNPATDPAPAGSPQPASTPGDTAPAVTVDGESFPALSDQPLPFSLQRADEGQAVSADELKAFTQRYLDLLKATRYFDFVNERAHGWPQSDPQGRFWFGQWWEYTFVVKSGGKVTYQHTAPGSDNTGVPTSNLLEGACYASRIWQDAKYEKLTRKLGRALDAWTMAMRRAPDDNAGVMLARAFYPASVDAQEDGRSYSIDYSLARPGTDNDATEFVHVAANPTWGDIWIKNKRSKDDMGHMLSAVAHLSDCGAGLADAEAQRDLLATRKQFRRLAQKVVADGYVLASLDKQAQEFKPSDLLAHYISLANAECPGMLAYRILGTGKAGNETCGSGIGLFDSIAASNPQNRRILESHHEAATVLARDAGIQDVGLALAGGLGDRLKKTMDALASGGQGDAGFKTENFAAELMHAANAGVPLTSREIRWLHARIDEAVSGFGALGSGYFDVFSPNTPDGRFPFNPVGKSLEFREIGVLLGTCASRLRNPAARPVLDCDMIKAAKL